MPGSDDGTIISSITIFDDWASAAVVDAATRMAASISVGLMIGSLAISLVEFSARLAVIDRVRPHVGSRRDAVRHVEKGRDRRDVEDVAGGAAGATESL